MAQNAWRKVFGGGDFSPKKLIFHRGMSGKNAPMELSGEY